MKLSRLKTKFGLGGVIDRTWNPAFDEGQFLEGFQNEDQSWMAKTLLHSMNAVGWSSPNPAVGCLIVKNGKILASGFTQEYKKEHAEKMAFDQLEKNGNAGELEGSILYVTLEPCAHQGFQPPCLDLVLNSPIKKVVIACVDPDVRVSGKSIQALRSSGKEVVVGILEDECKAWHFPFLFNRTQSRTFWVAKWAQSQEGLLADSQGVSKWITGPKSRAYTHWLRQKYDAILVGAGTYLKDQPLLNVRDCTEPIRRNPQRLVFDPKGHLIKKGVITDSSLLVFVCDSHSKGMQPGWVVISDQEPIQSMYEKINQLGMQSIMVEGGASLLNQLFEKGLIDACHQFVGAKKFNDTLSRHQLNKFNEKAFFLLQDQIIDDDHLREWIK